MEQNIKNGHLIFGGCDTVDLAEKYGTPLYLMDENKIRKMCRVFKNAFEGYENFKVLYASKAFCCTGINEIINSEGLGIDVVSKGELLTALQVGIPPENIYFHGNNKTIDELECAIKQNVGYIVLDGLDEIDLVNEIAGELSKCQKVLIRVNTGVEAHTHHFIQTSLVDSKFGLGIKDGQTFKAIEKVINSKHLNYIGLHSHIGSQIFDDKPFALAIDILFQLIDSIKSKYHLETRELNVGGGFGIWYNDSDAKKTSEQYAIYVKTILERVNVNIEKYKLTPPCIVIEPGRAIVGEAGITLYTVGAIKEIPQIKKYLSVDGGMFENPRYALYQANYTAMLANKADKPAVDTVTISGKCCESADMLIVDAKLQQAERGDIMAIFSTGAYNYAMASNYNRNLVPPVVILNNGKSDFLVTPQTYEDLLSHDVLPYWLKKQR